MAKARMIHVKIWDSHQFNSLSIPERLLYIATIVLSDDYGCFRYEGKYFKRNVFHGDSVSARRVDQMLQKIVDVGLVNVFEEISPSSVEKLTIGVHANWNRYQKFRKDVTKTSFFSAFECNEGETPNQRFVARMEDK